MERARIRAPLEQRLCLPTNDMHALQARPHATGVGRPGEKPSWHGCRVGQGCPGVIRSDADEGGTSGPAVTERTEGEPSRTASVTKMAATPRTPPLLPTWA